MVSIQGLPPSSATQSKRTKKTGKKRNVAQGNDASAVSQPTQVAHAVSHSLSQVQASDIQRAQVHYDLPEGRSRKALEEYLDVMNQARKEELAQLLGVDIYI